ncbi:MAG: transglutaminase-like domain-containing protein [Methanomassiliicoccaceae archaeon]|nr:transglutaminase-like domain-containing protein [Methanomassiliicoccaceae archaeon]
MNMFIADDGYVDHSDPAIVKTAGELFSGLTTDTEKARAAFEYVRDEISHSIDVNANVVTAKASDVLRYRTGICHSKANLLAALLRSDGIPAGFCFQRLILTDDPIRYCVHCFNAVFAGGRWIKLDARGNKKGVNAQFSLDEPMLAFPPRKELGEYVWNGIFARPHSDTMKMLEKAGSIRYVIENLPDNVNETPDITE